jgi:hypothetical protein
VIAIHKSRVGACKARQGPVLDSYLLSVAFTLFKSITDPIDHSEDRDGVPVTISKPVTDCEIVI